MFSALLSDSGAMYSNFVRPALKSWRTSTISRLLSEEFHTWATPSDSAKLRSASTWFFISAISGEITMATPSISSAGSW